MRTFYNTTFAICAGLTIAMVGPAPCEAIDFQPFDWVPLPPGTNVGMGYYVFGTRNEYNSTITGTVKDNTGLDSHIGIARYLYYNEMFGHPYVLDCLVPFGALKEGRINGNRLGNASGLGDPTASVGFWFVNRPEKKRYLSAAGFLSLPIGSYDKSRALNLGGNRWQHDLQVDFTQGFLDKFTIDVSGDRICYSANTEAGRGNQKLSQDSTFGAYAWLTYDVTPEARSGLPAAISIGYAGTFGGAQKLDGAAIGTKTEEHQVRLTYSQFIARRWQVLISFNHDVSVSGQFKQDFGLLLRVTTLF